MIEKSKLKKALRSISSDEENAEFDMYEKRDREVSSLKIGMARIETRMDGFASKKDTDRLNKSLLEIGDIQGALLDDFTNYAKLSVRHMQEMGSFIKELNKTFKEVAESLGSTIKTSSKESREMSVPLYRQMITELSGTAGAIKNWRWPQYSSVSVRNKNFANIDPSTEDKAGTVSTGTKSVTSAGSAVQISATSVPIYAVYIQAHESNAGTIVVGDTNVVATLVGRRGLALYPTNFQKFVVSDLNLLWIDATNSGDKVNYYVEKA